MNQNPHTTLITADAPIAAASHGGRAKCLQRLVRLDLPVPPSVALSFDAVRRIADGDMVDVGAVLGCFDAGTLLCVRPSSEDPDWGGPGAVMNVGMNDDRLAALAPALGRDGAEALYLRFVKGYAIHVARLDADAFAEIDEDAEGALARALETYAEEADEPFPQDPAEQIAGVLRSMARAWQSTSARLLRQAKGAPSNAGLGLIVQEMIPGVGPAESGSGVLQLVNPRTGEARITGRYLSQSQGREALGAGVGALYLERDPRGPSLEEAAPEAFAALKDHAALMRRKLREEMQVEFVLQAGEVFILDGVRVPRSARAAVEIAVRLAEDGIIPREEACMRIEPRALGELMHPQVDRSEPLVPLARGVAASPGAAQGRIVFSPAAAQACAARDEPCILVRRETTPEDIRGMHAAQGVLTERGGMTSHAAVIARGLGLPCVVGASELRFQIRRKQLRTASGLVLKEGDWLTLDGTRGQVLEGRAPLIEAAQGAAFGKLMDWAAEASDIGIRANADTIRDAEAAVRFGVTGIGLCRTEHMFFEADRLTVMREMIFADTPEDRRAVLDLLLPMQRGDFVRLFRIMEGKPVCIRLFDPPLHEFLPSDTAGLRDMAEALSLSRSQVERRIEELQEYNPMLGLRGVRLGITVPEIYEMQARAIFEATLEASRDGAPVVPEIMIPLVSARREVELVKQRVDAVAASVQAETGQLFSYRLGVMVETPRAALRAGDIALHAEFLSFGTNDLTQMAYGLSRDDAGRFMSAYVNSGVFAEDPFHMLDFEGVGELLQIGADRGRAVRPDVVLSICGEHGGNPESIAFCRACGFSYVSCSPYRVPIARLAAAQAAISDRLAAGTGNKIG